MLNRLIFLCKQAFSLSTIILASSYSGALLGQDIHFENLFFTPILLSQADSISLHENTLSEQDRRSAVEAIPRLQEDIEKGKADELESAELIQLLNTLGLAQQALGEYQQALTTFMESAALASEEFGEQSLEIIPMLEQATLSHLSLNQIDEITELEEQIYDIKASHYDAASPEMFTATQNLADWYTSVYFKENFISQNRKRRRSTFSQANIAETLPGRNREPSFDPSDIREPNLAKISRLYENYQRSYNDSTTLTTIAEITRRFTRLAYHTEQEADFKKVRDNINTDTSTYRRQRNQSFDKGKDALEYIVKIMKSLDGVPAQQITLASLDLADWHLAYGQIAAAKREYQATYQVLLDEGFSNETIDMALFSAIPAAIPRIAAFPVSQQTAGGIGLKEANYLGFIDVSFGIDDLGNAIDINLIRISDESIPRIWDILETQLKITKFRPLLESGDLFSIEPTELRYYYSY